MCSLAVYNRCWVVAAAQVFATSLNAYFQLTIMLMVLVIGVVGLAHYHPFEDPGSQGMQVNDGLNILKPHLVQKCHIY